MSSYEPYCLTFAQMSPILLCNLHFAKTKADKISPLVIQLVSFLLQTVA